MAAEATVPTPAAGPIHPVPAKPDAPTTPAPKEAVKVTGPAKKKVKITPEPKVQTKGRKSLKAAKKKSGDLDVPTFKAKKVATPGTSRPASKVTLI